MTDFPIDENSRENSRSAGSPVQNILANVSPSLWSRLVARFGASDLEIVSTAYSNACQNGALEEGFQRAPGASFNPRPARIATLLLDTMPNSRLEDILLALVCSQEGYAHKMLNQDSGQYEIDQEKCKHANEIQAVSYGTMRRELKGVSEIVAGILILDMLRHHHLMPYPPKVDYVSEFLNAATQPFKESRLYLLIHTALKRCRGCSSRNIA